MARVLVLGGGFGGLATAHELRRGLPEDDEVVLVASRDHFYVGFAKLWDMVGTRSLADGTAPLAALERHGITFRHEDVLAVDPARREVKTSSATLTGDGLVVALGAGYAPAHLARLGPGAHNLYDAGALPGIRAGLEEVEDGRILVSILGGPYQCPPAPYEAALLIDEWLRARGRRDRVDLTISTPMPLTLPVAGPDASRFLADQLAERGVEVLTEHPVEAVDHERRRTRFAGGEERDWQLWLTVPAASPPPVLASGPLANDAGWVEPDPVTFATPFERVYAVGDCTQIPTAVAQLPKAGVFAEAGGHVAALNLAADLHGGERASFGGEGYCYLELPGRQVATVTGNFYARPTPDVTLTEPDPEAYRAKQQWERDRLDGWL